MTVTDVRVHEAPATDPRKGDPGPRRPGMPRLLNFGAITATWRRQLSGLLLNPLGYVFILVFVLASAAILFWSQAYYARNIADLDPLLNYMPWLLVVLLPALSMGAWASERELGTEEQLLTLPMGPADALLGKWLGVVTYFTLALLFSLSNVIVLAWLGDPDPGMVAANYAGWWLAGLAFAALAILASTLVGLPAVAFVIGVLFCAALMGLFWGTDWFDPYNRGLIPLGRTVMALVIAASALGAATLLLSARRWQRQRRGLILGGAVVFAALCVTGINLSVLADRAAADWDVTQENLSSLSPASREILSEIKEPVTVVAFISEDLPPELQLKGREVENTLKALARSMGGRLTLDLRRPADPLDADGSLATQFYGLTPRRVQVNTAAGREEREVFLAAAITGGARTQRIEHFDPGLSVEYELVRALRAVGAPQKKVLGIVQTDLRMTGGFDFQTRSSTPRWQIVAEWERQYEVRDTNLDVPVAADVSVLVVPQPSRLGAAQVRNLHDYVWSGRPALFLEDPMPVFSSLQLASSQPKGPNPMAGMGMPPPEPDTGEFRELLRALAIDAPADLIVWSDFNPSHAFRRLLTPNFVWAYRDRGSMGDRPVMTGIDSLLLPFPGLVRHAPDPAGELSVHTLFRPAQGVGWGWHTFRDHVAPDPFMGQLRPVTPRRFTPEPGEPPALAVEVTGHMRRAFPFPAPREEPTTAPATGPSTAPATTPAAAAATKPTGIGERSAKPVHVIYIADTDLAHDQFFEFYRNPENRFGQEELRFLQDLRNVQLLGNAVDALAGDAAFLGLRTRRPQRRPLEKLEQVLAQTQKSLRDVESSAQADAEQKIQKLRDDLRQRLDKIRERTDLDENAKRQLVAQVERSANRQLEEDIRGVNRESELKVRQARIGQQRQFQRVLNVVRARAMGFPAIVLMGLAGTVFLMRMRGERLTVPESRRRKD